MAFSHTYDTATPPGGGDPAEADDRMREIKAAVQERLAVEHVFALTGTEVSGANTGKHTDITTTSIVNAGALANAGNVTINTDKFTIDAATGNVVVAGTLDVAGAAEITGVATLGDASLLKTSAAPTTDAMLANKKYVDDQVDTQNMTPASYAGEESITFPDGFIMKQGTATPASAADVTVTFAAAFPTAITNAWCTWREAVSNDVENCGVHTLLVGSMKVRNPNTGWAGKTVNWFAIGY